MQIKYEQLVNSISALDILIDCALPAKSSWKISKYIYIINSLMEELSKKEINQDAVIDLHIDQIKVEELGDAMITPRTLVNLSWLFY